MTRTIIIVGLLAVALGCFLSKRPDEPCLGPDYEYSVDAPPPAIDGPAPPISFFVQPDQLFVGHEVDL